MNTCEDMLKSIKNMVIQCKKCELWKTKTYTVFGEGNSDADIMFVGEAPGYNEDRTGKPFCGKAGKILDELLEMINIERKDVYITNILKCRPPNNRNPSVKEINACTPYLDKQIEIIQPRIICCLGNFATAYILKRFGFERYIDGISKIHSNVFTYNTLQGKIKIIPLYHPAVATYNINMMETLKTSFKKIKQELEKHENCAFGI